MMKNTRLMLILTTAMALLFTAGCDTDEDTGEQLQMVCGDGIVDFSEGETCDDAGESASCDVDCTDAFCSDGVTNFTAGEACDDGGESAFCNADCTVATCGDGAINITAGEECDDVGESATCDVDCTNAACGDGLTNATAGEDCDDGNSTNGDGCENDCTTSP